MAMMIMPKSMNFFGCSSYENGKVGLVGVLPLAGNKFCSHFLAFDTERGSF
jgi:hypothetical protein